MQYRATDEAGNTARPQSVAFAVVDAPDPDNTAPEVDRHGRRRAQTTRAPTSAPRRSPSPPPTRAPASPPSNTRSTARPYAAYTAPVAVNQPGAHTLSARATDEAGNTSEPETVTFTVVDTPAPDTTAPTVTAAVTGDQNESGAYVGSATVTVTATDAESGVDTVEYAVDGGAYAAYTAPVTVNAVGQHTVTFRATDEAGNTSTPGSVQFAVVDAPNPDNSPPAATATVTGTRNTSGAYVGAATVTIAATDEGSGVDSVEYSLDGAPYAAYTAPVTVNQVGAHSVSYRATDNAGNTSTPQTATFTVVAVPNPDTTAPTVNAALAGQLDGSWSYIGSATVTLTATDTESGVLRVEYALDGRGYLVYTGPVTVNTPGAHTFSYRATDRAGNVSSTASTTFTVVESGPPAPTCRVADNRTTVWMGTHNSGVANRVVERGCSINDLVLDESPWASTAEFVAHVTEVADRLHSRGFIPLKDRNGLVRGRPGEQRRQVRGGAGLRAAAGHQGRLVQALGAGRRRRFPPQRRRLDLQQAGGRPGHALVPGAHLRRLLAEVAVARRRARRTGAPTAASSSASRRCTSTRRSPRPEWVAIKYGHEMQIFDSPSGDITRAARSTGSTGSAWPARG